MTLSDGLLIAVFAWLALASLQWRALAYALRTHRDRLADQRAEWDKLSQAVSSIAEGAIASARVVAECRKRIERLERLTGLSHTRRPN